MLDELQPLPPPRAGERLFGPDYTMPMANACMSPGHDYSYREGYRLGAYRLAEHVCETARDQDLLIYPIVFLYRHHVELTLKRLVQLVANLAEVSLDDKCLRDLDRHRIDELWNNLRSLLKSPRIKNDCGLDLPSPDVEGITEYIKQLSKVDPDSQRFRYARTKNGDVSLPDDLRYINVAIFFDSMEKLCRYLDNVDTWLDHILEIRNEMESEFRSAMYAEYADCMY